MPVISERYREQTIQLHAADKSYGADGTRHAKHVVDIANSVNSQDILDYGCGKGGLAGCLNIPIKEYDPCIADKDAQPATASIVVCANVLEHVEPQCMDAVLEDIDGLMQDTLLLIIDTSPKEHILSDMYDVQATIMPIDQWLVKLLKYWDIDNLEAMGTEFKLIMTPKKPMQTGIYFTKVRVENTNSCKYTCEMCPREKMTRPTGIMPPEDYEFFLSRLKDYVEETNLPQPFASTFYLHGYGEPLFDPKLAVKSAMVDEHFPASQSFIYTTLGVKLPASYFETLLGEGKLRNLVVSLYGFQEHTYKAIQRGGDFLTVRENLLNVARVNDTLGRPCNIQIQLLIPFTTDAIENDPSEAAAFNELMSIVEPLGVHTNKLTLHNFGNGREYNDANSNPATCSVVKGVRERHLNVTWDLKIQPCCLDFNAEIAFGDLREQSISDIYNDDAYKNFITAHVTGNLDDYPLCKGCDVR